MVEFNEQGGAVHVVPTDWLDEDMNGKLNVWWPPDSWSDSRRNKAIEGCAEFDSSYSRHQTVRVLFSYSE